MKEKAQAILKHFGEEKQNIKGQEEYLELQIALMELSKFRLKQKLGQEKGSDIQLIDNCNEELADNIVIYMQFEKVDFEEALKYFKNYYTRANLIQWYFLQNFTFDRDLAYKIVQEKIERTIQRFNIPIPAGTDLNSIEKTGVYLEPKIENNMPTGEINTYYEKYKKMKNKGFTLTELMIVVAIISIVVAMGYTGLKRGFGKEKDLKNVVKVMVTTDKRGINTYTAIEKDGDTFYINGKEFGKLAAQGIEIIK